MTRTATLPLTIPMSPGLTDELALSEEGSYEDMKCLPPAQRERPLESHAHVVARRFSSRLRIETPAEAEDVYRAVCSGTFQSQSRAAWNHANKIADALRPIVAAYNPKTVKQWPAPYDMPEEH